MEQISDVLVIGSGLAGLSYALKVADFARVNLVTKRGLQETSTSKAQGGIAAVLGPDDRFEYHIQDTLTVGEGLSHPDIVELVVRQGPERVRELIDLGEGQPRLIGSGLNGKIPVEEMLQGLVVVFANLRPRKLSTIDSFGMVMCA